MNKGFVDISDVTNNCNTFSLDSGKNEKKKKKKNK
jgi:hypothetical protein